MSNDQAPGQPVDDTLMSELFGSDRDRTRAPNPEPEAQAPIPPPAEAQQPSQSGTPPPASTDDDDAEPTEAHRGQSISLYEHLQDRRKRKGQIRELTEQNRQMQAQMAVMQNFFAQMQQNGFPQPQRQQQQRPEPKPVPDMWTDPEGWGNHVMEQATQRIAASERNQLNRELNRSERRATATHGQEAIQAAKQWARQGGFLSSFTDYDDPYEELMGAFNHARTLHEIGGDLTSYRRRVQEEILQQLREGKLSLNQVQGQPNAMVPNGAQPHQQQPQRFPGTIANQPSSAHQKPVQVSDDELANSMFAHDRQGRFKRNGAAA